MKIINHEANGLQVSQRIKDGYINLTQMAKAYGKRVADWKENEENIALLALFRKDPIYKGFEPLISLRGRNGGTWGHPDIAIQFAQWLDRGFALQVSRWVREWMTTGQNPIPLQPMGNPINISSIVTELENLIISIRSHGRTIHTGSHQPVDPILFKSLHTLSHNQLSVISATIQHLELLKRIAEMNTQSEPTTPEQTINYLFGSSTPTEKAEPKAQTAKTKPTKTKQLTNINIKIPSSQRQWLADTARMVRQNNTKPLPPAQRVYPQHLVGIAIQLLQNTPIDIEAAHNLRLEQNEQPTTINIKISRQQQQWLTDTAQTIRHNTQQPTTPNERIYPQHLISIAIELLQNADINWQQVGSVDDIKKGLTTAPFQITACLV